MDSRHGTHGVRPLDNFGTDFRHAPVRDLAFVNELLHHPGRFFDRTLRIVSMLVVQIDVVGFESAQRTFYGLAYCFRS